jgi:hypothetical protein
MPYRVFRGRVRAIARENLGRVEGAACSSWEEIRRLYERPLPTELRWAQQHADRMGELMDELTSRA